MACCLLALLLLLQAYLPPVRGSSPFEISFPSALTCDEVCWYEGTLQLTFHMQKKVGSVSALRSLSFRVAMQDAIHGTTERGSLGPSRLFDVRSHCWPTPEEGLLTCQMDVDRVVEGRYNVNVSFFNCMQSRPLVLGAQSNEVVILRIPQIEMIKPRPGFDLLLNGQQTELEIQFIVSADASKSVLRMYSVEMFIGDIFLYREMDISKRGVFALRHNIQVERGCYNFSLSVNHTLLVVSKSGHDVFYHQQHRMSEVCFVGSELHSSSLSPNAQVLCSNMFCPCEHDGSCYNNTQCTAEIESSAIFDIMTQTILTAYRYHRGDFSSLHHQALSYTDIPVFVINLPLRRDKKAHIANLLKTVGFTSVQFPIVTLVDDINLSHLIARGWVTLEGVRFMQQAEWIREKAVLSYIARAIDHLKILEEAVKSGNKYIGVFEDDLMLQEQPRVTRRRIEAALDELPSSADMLFLEYCFENCSKLCRKTSRFVHIARAHRPYCSGAIIFTARGARNVLKLCKPVFGAIDNMFPMLIERGYLEAYVLNTPAFYQDAFWGSDVARQTKETQTSSLTPKLRLHRPIATHCAEDQTSLWSQMQQYLLVPVVGNGSTDNSYISQVYTKRSSDSAVSDCVTSPHGDLLLLSQDEAREVLKIPVCSQIHPMKICLITQFSTQFRKYEVECDIETMSTCMIEDREPLLLSQCEGRWSTTSVLSPINECYGSNWCQLLVFNQSSMWDSKYPGPPVWISLLLAYDVEPQDRSICFLTLGEEVGARAIWISQDGGGSTERNREEGLVELVYSRQEVRDLELLEVPACYAGHVMRANLLEEAIERFRAPLVRFELFVFCSLEKLRSGSCRDVARQSLRGWEERTSDSLAGLWEQGSDEFVLRWTEVSFVRQLSSSWPNLRSPEIKLDPLA